MPRFKTVRRVPFTSEQMFALVADVERYPEFLPLCESLAVHSREPTAGGVETIVATMGIGYKSIRETFTTRVMLDPGARTIHVAHVNGPFRHLDNFWTFHPQGAASDVDFAIDYEFRSPVLGLLMGAVFESAFRRFSEAFETRAGAVYGRPGRLGSDPGSAGV